MEKFIGYLPVDRRLAITRGESLAQTTSGAALVAEISGMAVLASAMHDTPGIRPGVEELNQKINEIYGGLIEAIHDHRGSIVQFSGFRLVCWFAEDHGLQAVSAALAMQAHAACVRDLVPGRIGLKIAVASGKAYRLCVGDPSIQLIDLLAGPAVLEAAELCQNAADGGLLVSGEVMEMIGRWVQIQDIGMSTGGVKFGLIQNVQRVNLKAPWPQLSRKLRQAELRPWLPFPIYVRLLTNQDPYPMDFHDVAGVCLAFAGLDFEADPEAARHLDQFVRWVQNTANRHGGYLLNLELERTGGQICLSFGAPTAHSDDTDRAIAAALDLRKPLPFPSPITNIRLGLSSARVCMGSFGSEARRGFGMVCEEFNLSSGLVKIAKPGQILADGNLLARVERHFSWLELGERDLQLPLTKETVRVLTAEIIDAIDYEPLTLADPIRPRAAVSEPMPPRMPKKRGTPAYSRIIVD